MASAQEITGLYQELLGRAPDAGGLANYSKYGSIGAVRNSILGSAEYKSRSATPAPTVAPAPASNPIIDFAARQKADSDALIAKQNKEQEGLFTNYEKIRKGQEALPALYNRLQTEAGIPGLSQAAQGFKNEIYSVKDKLDRLGEDVLARTTGTLTTEAQRRRLETAEAEPLQTNLGRLGTGLAPIADMLTSANQSVATQMGLQTEQQDRELEGIKLRINSISDKFARELTGFTTSREAELTGILDKLNRDRALSDRDWELAQTIAAEERAFSRQKSLASTQLMNSASAQTAVTAPKTASTPAVNVSDYLNSGKVSSLVPNKLNTNIIQLGGGTAKPANTFLTSTPSNLLTLNKPGSTGAKF